MDAFRVERETVWHWINFVEGKMIFKPNLFWGRYTLLIIIMETLFNNFVIYYIYTIVNLTN